jgi:hypothetical protein
MTVPKQPAKKIIVFRFSGGARDGQAIRSDQPQAAKETLTLWERTWNGKVGRRFDVTTLNAPTYQRYQVKSTYEAGGEIHVTCEHVD